MPRRYSMETRQATAATVRERILEAALDELVAVGVNDVTMQGVGRRADLALRTLYNHFPSRDALLTAAFLRHAARTRAEVEDLVVVEAPPEDQLQQIVEAYYRRYAQMGERLTLLLSARGEPQLEREVAGIRDWRRMMIRRVIDGARRSGRLRIPEATAVALTFTMTSHAAWLTLRAECGDDPALAMSAAVRALKSAIFVTPTTSTDN